MLSSKHERKPLSVLIAMDAHRLQHHGDGDDHPAEEEDGDDEADAHDERHDDEEMIQAAQEILDAKTHGDARMLNEALCNWVKLYHAKEEEDEESTEDEGEEGGDREQGGEEEDE